MLDSAYLEEPGSVGSSSSFQAPPTYVTVPGATADAITRNAYEALESGYLESATALARAGHTMLTSNCGFTIPFQDVVQKATDTPAALSSLLLVPLLARVYGARFGVLTFSASALDARRRAAAHWPDIGVPVADMQHSATWRALNGPRGTELRIQQMRGDLLESARRFVAAHELKALLLECTGFSAFRSEIERATRVRTFDIVDLVNYLLIPNVEAASGCEDDKAVTCALNS